MAKHKTRVVIAWMGGAMFTLGVAALSLRIPEWSAIHHGELTGAAIVGFAGAVIAGIAWLATKDDEETKIPPQGPPVATLKMAAQGEISQSPQIGTIHGNVYVGDKNLEIPSIPSQEPTHPLPTLLIRSPKKVIVDCYLQRFCYSEQGPHGMVVVVENPLAKVGEKAVRALGIVASIRFLRYGELLGTVGRAYWLNYDENKIDINPGESKAVLVGLYEPATWLAYSNSRSAAPPPPRSGRQMSQRLEAMSQPLNPTKIFLNPELVAKIFVLSTYTGHTLAEKSYRIFLFKNPFGDTEFTFEETL